MKTEEIEALEHLCKKSTKSTVRKHSQCLLLSHQRRTIIDLSGIVEVNRKTIERWFNNWAKNGIDFLPIQPGRGIKTQLKGLERVIYEQGQGHSRTLKNVFTYLEKQKKIPFYYLPLKESF